MPAKYKLVLRKDMRKGGGGGCQVILCQCESGGDGRYPGVMRPDCRRFHGLVGGCEADPGRVGPCHAPQPRQRGGRAGRRVGEFPVTVRQYRNADREGVQQCPDQKQTHPVSSGQAVARRDFQLHLRKDHSRKPVRSFGRGRGRETGRALGFSEMPHDIVPLAGCEVF